jgi:hypothetical protein
LVSGSLISAARACRQAIFAISSHVAKPRGLQDHAREGSINRPARPRPTCVTSLERASAHAAEAVVYVLRLVTPRTENARSGPATAHNRRQHTEAHYWRVVDGERIGSTPEQWSACHRRLIADPAWVMDGMKLGVLDKRLARADTVIYLDLCAAACLGGIVQRRIRYRGRLARGPRRL